jgi:hypothetical protein
LKNKKPSGKPVTVKVRVNLNNHNRRYPDGKKTKRQYQESPHW